MIVYLGLGSNIEPVVNIESAKQVLFERFENVRFSQTFESQAIGFDGDNFLNLVAEVTTDESLPDLMVLIKDLEQTLGRVTCSEKFSSRLIDIDILLYGNLVCNTPIVLPREEIRENAYVLWPLAELAPYLVEPGGELTYGELWSRFDRSSQQLTPLI